MKSSPFISPDLQKTLKKISDMELDYVQNILPSFVSSSSIQQMQEILSTPYKDFFQSYAAIVNSSFTESLSQMSKSINSTICSGLTAGIYNNLNETLKNAFPLLELQEYIQEVIPKLQLPSKSADCSESLYSLPPSDDYVIVDEPVAKTYEIPDSVAIPIGSKKVKLPTSLFFAIIQTIINTIVSISIAIAQSNPAAIETQQKQLQIEEVQLQLQQDQNEMLYQLLHNIDVSSSSEAQAITELKEAVEEQNVQISQLQDNLHIIEEESGNHEAPDDTADSK